VFGKQRKISAPAPTPQTVVTRIELSDETRQSLVALENDIQTLQTFMEEMIGQARDILGALHGEITSQLPVARDELDGVQVFTDELPPHMHGREMNPTVSDEDRVRSTPFTRAPRRVQVDWLKNEVLSDGEWHTTIDIARRFAVDERHFRYMRGATGHRLREMHEDRIVERRSSQVKGAMFEYRLLPPT
jgi:hypothetical protein